MRKSNVLAAINCAALIAGMFFSGHAQAISLRFKSKIFSSGPIMYACNAGIGSSKPEGKACYFKGNPANGVCTPDTCTTAKKNCQTDCVCTGTYGSWLPANLVATIQPIDNNGQPVGPISSPKRISASGEQFVKLFSGSASWNNRIDNVATFFPQDMYTGKYFIDICYKGSQIPDIDGLYTISTQTVAIPFAVLNSQGFKARDNNRDGLDFDNVKDAKGLDYLNKSGLTVQTFVVCSNNLGSFPDFAENSQGKPTGGINSSFFHATAEAPMTSSASNLPAHGRIKDPKFCKIRYIFKETSFSKPNPIARDHKAEGAEICTYTEIQDPPVGALN